MIFPTFELQTLRAIEEMTDNKKDVSFCRRKWLQRCDNYFLTAMK